MSGPMMGINRIWVHPSLRRRGLAGRLLDKARNHFLLSEVVPRENIAFSDPTEIGLAFARAYLPGGKVQTYRPRR